MAQRDTVVRNLVAKIANAPQIGDTDNLLNSGLLDSAGIFTLVAGLQKAFKLQIPTSAITEQNFQSIASIADMVQRLGGESTK